MHGSLGFVNNHPDSKGGAQLGEGWLLYIAGAVVVGIGAIFTVIVLVCYCKKKVSSLAHSTKSQDLHS